MAMIILFILFFSFFPGVCFAQLNLPLRQWVAKPISGPFNPNGGAKHIAVAVNPVNNLIYLLGGDHNGTQPAPSSPQSGRNEMYTYNAATNAWNFEQRFCRVDGGLQPSGPDEVGWTYDSKRNVFWMMPGFQQHNETKCNNANVIRNADMAYDPALKTWKLSTLPVSPRGFHGNFLQHDPVTDSLIRFANAGPEAVVFTFALNTWERIKNWGLPNLNFEDQGTTIDVKGRAVYLVTGGRLWRYNIDTTAIEDLGPTPSPTPAESKPLWDSVNQVLLWPYFDDVDNSSTGQQERVHLHVYHPNTRTWEQDIAPAGPGGKIVKGRHAIFDAKNNALVVFGNVWNRPVGTDLFLFRYAQTTQQPPSGASGLNIQWQ